MNFVTKLKLIVKKIKLKMNKGKIIKILIICGIIFFIYLIHEPVIDMLKGLFLRKILGLE
ncbi:MAG: hypothetical protein TV41_00530 [Wolbachia endosymbiont of Dactylopius coccus]|nr:MAG: hypothetical protein TV41_00530 [Wolbachia endosymbiont of Dactylopius coccus]